MVDHAFVYYSFIELLFMHDPIHNSLTSNLADQRGDPSGPLAQRIDHNPALGQTDR